MTADADAPRAAFIRGEASGRFDIERLARLTPLFIAFYFTAQFAMRLAVSGNLETDEAQFVGLTHFALGYGNAHPPLYNWLVALALELTGHWPAAVSLVKNMLLAGTYLLVFDTARRAAGSPVAGLCAAAGLALMPQIVWQSQFTLAHSVLVTFGVAALLHALTLAAHSPRSLPAYLYIGAAAAIGAYGKYNFFIVLAAAALAIASIPELRQRLLNVRIALSAAAFLALFGPHLAWALANLDSATNRVSKLERENSRFGAFDIPGLGIDGLLAIGTGLIASAGALALVWLLLRRGPHAQEPQGKALTGTLARLYARTALFAVALFAAIILLGDFHFVFERYLTPLILPLPLWLALAAPLGNRAAGRLMLTAGAVWLAALIAVPSVIAFGEDHFAHPYRAFAQEVAQRIDPPYAVLARRDRQSANIAIRLPGATVLRDEAPQNRVLIVWSGKDRQPPESLVTRLGPGFSAEGPAVSGTYAYENWSGASATLGAQLFVRR